MNVEIDPSSPVPLYHQIAMAIRARLQRGELQAGDTLLRLVGNLLGGAIRPEDHAVRYGGDEFLLLLPDTNSQQAGAIAERLVRLFAQYTMPLGRGCDLSISAGVASIQADAVGSGQALVARADAALYAAKRRGKNTVIGCAAG